MIQNIITSSIVFLSVVFQISFLSNFFPSGLVPDITLIIIIIWVVRSDFNSVLKWAILAGLMTDVASFQPIGVNIFSFVMIAFMINSLSKRFLVPQFAWKSFIVVIMVMFGVVINQLFVVSLIKIAGHLNGLPQNMLEFFNRGFFWKLAYDLGMFAILYMPLKKLDRVFAYQNNNMVIKR